MCRASIRTAIQKLFADFDKVEVMLSFQENGKKLT